MSVLKIKDENNTWHGIQSIRGETYAGDVTREEFDKLSKKFETHIITKDDLESGSWSYSTKVNSSSRIRNKELMPVSIGTRIVADNPTKRLFIGILETKSATSYLHWSWKEIGAGLDYTVSSNGFLVILVEEADITVDDYDCTISIIGSVSSAILNAENNSRQAARVTAMSDCLYWRNGGIRANNGEIYGSTTYILSETYFGYTDGVFRITCDEDYLMFVFAYDMQNDYVGLYKTTGNFDKLTDTSKYALINSFDCTQFPDYRMRLMLRKVDSSNIDPSYGVHVHFHTTDTTLSEPYMSANSKAVGDAINSLRANTETNIDILSHQIADHTIIHTIDKSELEQGSWSYSTKVSSASRIRNKELYPVFIGMEIKFTNPTKSVYFGVLKTTTSTQYASSSGWVQPSDNENTFTINRNGYLVILVEESGITVDDYDCSINIMNDWLTVYKNITMFNKEIEENYSKLFMIFRKVGVLGDSISVGFGPDYYEVAHSVRDLPNSWVKQVGRDSGLPWLNFGQSGYTTKMWCESTTYGRVQMEKEGNKCQAYVIGLGYNDQWHPENGIPVGTTEDIVDDPDVEAATFYGNYNRIIQLLKRRNPECKIFCLTVPSSSSASYNEAVSYIATQHYTVEDNVFLVDLLEYYDYFTREEYGMVLDKDGAHFSIVGYRMIATVIEKAIGKVMFENQLLFKNSATIPYDKGRPTEDTMEISDSIYWTDTNKADIVQDVLSSQEIAALQTKAITDTGGYYTTDTVEGALQEIGAEIAGVNTLIGTGVIS